MKVRALDSNHDWQFGKGRNDYKQANAAIVQNIDTRLNAFLGDCFFDTGAGIDWFNLLGAKSTLPLELSVRSVILNTEGVVGLIQLSLVLTAARRCAITYQVQSVYSTASGIFQFDTGASNLGGT